MKISDQRPVMIRWKDTLVIPRDPVVTEEMGGTEVDEADSNVGCETELVEASS
ncbi:hypothetical protein [Desulfovibrio subterraneus]|uniref:Uncharacterized protein n=1 Tax=Desulfovibrio subterraneus TaxID=2718620 RepID=A0A7J0BNY7_9BACT|nr:hypothetical protein [Desulfovibrio subterraneus]GFM34875.1 hypothetical protein DSM101010T_32400 [Desulfovibrio subterraneus]